MNNPQPAAGTCFLTPYGAIDLQRYPARRAEPPQAWCAADSLLLDAAHQLGTCGSATLVVNDGQRDFSNGQ